MIALKIFHMQDKFLIDIRALKRYNPIDSGKGGESALFACSFLY